LSCGGILFLQTSNNSVTITELPVRTWTQPYKEFLEGLLKGAAATTAAAGRKKAGDAEAAGGAGVWLGRQILEWCLCMRVAVYVTQSQKISCICICLLKVNINC
jgi:hypothetical protein